MKTTTEFHICLFCIICTVKEIFKYVTVIKYVLYKSELVLFVTVTLVCVFKFSVGVDFIQVLSFGSF